MDNVLIVYMMQLKEQTYVMIYTMHLILFQTKLYKISIFLNLTTWINLKKKGLFAFYGAN